MIIFKELAVRWRASQDEAVEKSFSSLAVSSLERKKEVPGERSFIIRIRAAMQRGEIQIVDSFPSNEPEEPIALRLGSYQGQESRGKVVSLVVKTEWIENAVQSPKSSDLDFLYNGLKAALEEVDALRADGRHVITRAECQAIELEEY